MNKAYFFGDAAWIGTDEQVKVPLFRRNIEAGKLAQAEITICGLGFFELFINGQRVSEDQFIPVTSDYVKRDIIQADGQPFDEEMNHRVYAVRFDVTGYLKEGTNAMAVLVGPGWFGSETWTFNDAYTAYGKPRLIYRLVLKDQDGRETVFLSGNEDRVKESFIKKSNLFTGETHDMRGYSENTWNTEEITKENGYVLPEMLEDLDTEYYLQDCPPDRIVKKCTPVRLKQFADAVIYDAGANISGWVDLKLTGQPGDRVYLKFSEKLNIAGALDQYHMYNQYFEVICGEEKDLIVHLHFTWLGFRYFSVEGPAEPVSVSVIHTDVLENASFECEDETLNYLFRTYIDTQYMNMHAGIPSDCPHTERRGYTGDGQLCSKSGMMLLDSEKFYRKWMQDIMDCQDRKTGHVQYTAPYTRCGGGPGGWGCAIITVPYNFYLQFGDPEPMREMFPQMLEYLRYLNDHSENGLVVSDREGEWCLGDWCPPIRKVLMPEPYVNTYYHIRSLRMVREIAQILHISGTIGFADGENLDTREERITAAFLKAYEDPETGDFCKNTQGANAFALDLGFGDERTLRHMAERYEKTGQYDTGIIGTELVTRILFEKGYGSIAAKLLASKAEVSFDGMRRAGATTLWEYWPSEYERSLSHPMFGAVTYTLITDILGIRQPAGSSGFEKIIIAPQAADVIRRASGSLTTPRGTVRVSYETRDDGSVDLQYEVPEGIEVVSAISSIR